MADRALSRPTVESECCPTDIGPGRRLRGELMMAGAKPRFKNNDAGRSSDVARSAVTSAWQLCAASRRIAGDEPKIVNAEDDGPEDCAATVERAMIKTSLLLSRLLTSSL